MHAYRNGQGFLALVELPPVQTGGPMSKVDACGSAGRAAFSAWDAI
jgi:hypothetical protein